MCYQSGQKYAPHFDAFDLNTEASRRITTNGGQVW